MLLFIAVCVTTTLLVLASQGHAILDTVTSTLSPIFWEFVIAPLIVLVAFPFVFALGALTSLAILLVLALAVTLIIIIVNSPIFRRALDFAAVCSTLPVKIAVQFRACVSSIRTSTDVSKFAADQSTSLLKIKPTPNIKPKGSLERLEAPRRFKKRLPINYSGTKPTLRLDPLNDAHTRLTAHIARIGYKQETVPVRDCAVMVAGAGLTTPTQNYEAANLITAFTCSTTVEGDLHVVRISNQSSDFLGVHAEQPESSVTTTRSQIPSQTISCVEIENELTNTEPLPSSTESIRTTKPSNSRTASAVSDENWCITDTHSIEILSPESSISSTSESHSSLSPHHVTKPIRHTGTESTDHHSLAGVVLPIVSDPSIAGLTLNIAQVSASEQQLETNTYPPVPPDSEASQADPVPPQTASLPTQAEVHPIQTGQPILVDDNTSQPDPSAPIHGGTSQEMDIPVTPTYQDIHTELGQEHDGLVNAPPSSGSSALATAYASSQYGYMPNMPDASFTGELGSAANNHRVTGLDTMQMDSNTPLPSDVELLELATAAMTAEGMDWADDTLLSGLFNESTPALPPTNQDLLELDRILQLAAAPLAPLGPQTLTDTLAPPVPFPNPDTATSLATDEESPDPAGAAMTEALIGMALNNYALEDYNINLPNANMPILDPNVMELLDGATQSIITDLTNQTFEPAGTLTTTDLSAFGLTDPLNSGQIDPNELAIMWEELGVSLENWVGQGPGTMGFSDEDMMRMVMEFDVSDPTCSPAHMIPNQAPTPISAMPAIPNVSPPALATRQIKRFPLRRAAIENNARAMVSQRA